MSHCPVPKCSQDLRWIELRSQGVLYECQLHGLFRWRGHPKLGHCWQSMKVIPTYKRENQTLFKDRGPFSDTVIKDTLVKEKKPE